MTNEIEIETELVTELKQSFETEISLGCLSSPLASALTSISVLFAERAMVRNALKALGLTEKQMTDDANGYIRMALADSTQRIQDTMIDAGTKQ